MSDEFAPFASAEVMFEPFTGFLGSGSDTIPEPVSGFTVGAAAGRDGGGRLVERYWIGATDSGDQAVEPQMVAETYGFKQFSLLCAAIFDRCGRLAETKVGFGFTAHRNRLSRLIDPSLPSLPVEDALCTVTGYGAGGVLVRFSTGDGNPEAVTVLRGCLAPSAVHALAGGFRDLADWRTGLRVAAPEAGVVRREARQPGWFASRRGVQPPGEAGAAAAPVSSWP